MKTLQDLWEVLQPMTPDQRQKGLVAWDETRTYPNLGFQVLEDDYTNYDREGYQPKGNALDNAVDGEERAAILTAPIIPKGSLIFIID